MSKKATVIAVVNQKGGTGKTTTCENLGVGLAMEGKKVLLVDTDPQESLTVSMGLLRTHRLLLAKAFCITRKVWTICLLTSNYPVWRFLWSMR